MSSHEIIIMAGLVVCLGIFTFILADRLAIPSIVLLLGVGILAGPEMLGIIDPAGFGVGVQVLVPLLVAIIVFEGGIVLELHDLRQVSYPVQMLISVGALVTWGGATLAAHYVAGLTWPLALLFGALVSVTGPTVITPLMRRSTARERLKVLLKAEGVLVDAVGAILAVVVLDALLASRSPLGGAFDWLERLGIGVIVGGLGGVGLGFLLKRIGARLSTESTRLATLAGAIGIFIFAEMFASESGIAAAAVSGIVVGNIRFPHKEEVIHFKGDLTILSITIIFIVLAARLRFEDLTALGWGGVLTVALLIVVVRPLCVLASTLGSSLTWPERAFIAAVSPRGVVSASVATFAALELEKAGYAGSNLLIGLVFMTVIGTVLLQSFTTPVLAKVLGVEPMTTVIVGANELARNLGVQLAAKGRDPVLIDTDAGLVQQARQLGLTVIEGDAREPNVLAKAGIGRAESLLALTESEKVNAFIAQMAKTQYHIAQVIARTDSVATEKLLQEQQIKTMNPLGASVMMLDTMVRRPSTIALLNEEIDTSVAQEIRLSNPRIEGKQLKDLGLPTEVLVAMLRRNEALIVPNGSTQLKMGDLITLIGNEASMQRVVALFSEEGGERMVAANQSLG